MFLIGFGGVVHNMNKKVTKFSSEKKQLKKIFFSWGTIRGGGGMFRSLKKASGEKKQILQKNILVVKNRIFGNKSLYVFFFGKKVVGEFSVKFHYSEYKLVNV